MRIAAGLASALLALAAAGPALSQASPDQPPAAPAETPICTDRPTKANAPCTVPAGDFQIESDVVNWSRSPEDGASVDVLLAPNPTFKYGVSKSLDVELNWAPWAQVGTTRDGQTTTRSSDGDLFVRAKWAWVTGEVFNLSLIPYVKLPTANHEVGNGRIEGGLIAPMTVALPARFTLTLGPEFDLLANAVHPGPHPAVENLINLSRPVGPFTLYAEIWNSQDFDPTGTVTQTTADVAATYLLNKTLQLDIGANFGLDRAASRQQLYLGVSHRF